MKKEKSFAMNMCEGPILINMLKFAVPLMLSSILQLLFNAADVAVVGKFASDTSLGAVGCTGSLINLLTNLFVGLSVGANVIAARHFGAKREEELRKSVHTSMLVAIIAGAVLTVIGVLFAGQILVLMNTTPEQLPLASLYLKIYFCGMVPSMVYNFGSAILRAVGDTKRPMYYLTAAGVVNVIFNLFFVIVLQMDVAGVAVATVISQTISAVLVVLCLMREKGAIRFEPRKMHIDRKQLLEIMKVGIPAGLQGCIFSLSNVVIQSSINGFGEIAVSGSSAGSNLEGFVYVAMNSFHHATLSFMSQNYGAGKTDRMKKIAVCGVVSVCVAGLLLGNMEIFFGESLLRIYTSNPAVIAEAMKRMRITDVIYCFCGMMDVMVGILRGIGYSIMPMIVSLCGACGLRLIWIATVFQIPEYHTIETVYISYPISWMITFFVHLLCYFIVRPKVFHTGKYAVVKN